MHLAFALPDPAETGGGGGGYIDGLAGGLRDLGHHVEILAGADPTFPAGATPVVDGMLLPRLHHRLDALIAADAVVLVHHIAAAAGRDDASRERVLAIEASMLPRLRRIIATSQPVADRLQAEFGVSARAVPPGIRNLVKARPDPDNPIILAVGVLTRRKGHDHLLRAVARMTDLPWRLLIAGDSRREPAHVAELHEIIAESGLQDRSSLLLDPLPDVLEHAWQRATVFALATQWEGYPSAVAEALRRGIPSVVTSAANAETFLPPDAGAICPVDDMPTFGKCLRRLLFDRDLRADFSAAARTAGATLPSLTDRAREFAAILESRP